MAGNTEMFRIKCGEIYILCTDYFALSCEFCDGIFDTLEVFHLHLNEHFSKPSTNIDNADYVSCDSDCAYIPPAVDMKYNSTDNLLQVDAHSTAVLNFNPVESNKNDPNDERTNQNENGPFSNLKFEEPTTALACTTNTESYSDDRNNIESNADHKKLVNQRLCARNGKAAFECGFCCKLFKGRMSRDDHECSHTGRRPHLCRLCGKSFTTYPNLFSHMKLHGNYRPFVCTVCGKRFANNAKLTFHTRENHLPDTDPLRYFPCELCDYKLRSYAQLDRHRKTHKECPRSTFTCDYCQSQFASKGILAQHMRIHAGVKPYKCNYCQETFRQASNKIQHQKRHNH